MYSSLPGDQIQSKLGRTPMNTASKALFTQRHSRWFLCLLLVALLTVLPASCAHQPRNLNTYIQNLERPERDGYQQPEKVVGALNLTTGMVVADVGAGSGYFTRRLAQAVGDTGQVLAIDVEQKMLDYNKQELEKLGLGHRASYILGKPEDPTLPETSVDLVFMCNVYHHLEHHIDYLANTRGALTPNGRVVIIDFYHDDRSGHLGFPKHHLVPREHVISNMEQAGYTLSNEQTFLPRQYFLEFVKNKR
jgi:arsenite methyltransferase